MSSDKKKPSGFEFRKRKAEKIQQLEHDKKFMDVKKYIIQKGKDVISEDCIKVPSESSISESVSIELVNDIHEIENKEIDLNCVQDTKNEDIIDNSQEILQLSDCGNWPTIRNNSLIDELIKGGPNQIKIDNYPQNGEGRHFSNSYYTRKLSNGEVLCRRCLPNVDRNRDEAKNRRNYR
ncbi:zinc finger MYM-type protein 5-like [Leptopilina boulardi]|uniref:zinc finger MYM-type protein 5-like n=1 Tax=Leptopilina boulardi TaxID=63433 RepID=UPI0021F5E77A|nr:zinc finger MYM-type protein 5-like [Leptopilina boulardi]